MCHINIFNQSSYKQLLSLIICPRSCSCYRFELPAEEFLEVSEGFMNHMKIEHFQNFRCQHSTQLLGLSCNHKVLHFLPRSHVYSIKTTISTVNLDLLLTVSIAKPKDWKKGETAMNSESVCIKTKLDFQ